MQQAADAVDYLVTDDPNITLGYDAKKDVIIYNPSDPTFSAYNWDNVLTHELAHRVDRWFVNSSEVDVFNKAIKSVQAVSPENWEKIVEYCHEKDRDGFLSDTIDALCESQYQLPFRHGREYWTDTRKTKEIFANLFSLEAIGDIEKITFIKKYFPELMEVFDGLDFALR